MIESLNNHQYDLSGNKERVDPGSAMRSDASAARFLTANFGGQATHFRSSGAYIKDQLLSVENRIKSKFNHVTKLESSLDQLLSKSAGDHAISKAASSSHTAF
jgi:hypothetical protein